MVHRIISIFIFFISMTFMSWGQSSVESKISEVYGDYTSSITDAQYSWIENCYSRCEVLNESDISSEGVSIQNLSDVGIMDKFVPTLTHDTSYNPESFNPLKYTFNFHKKNDQYYRIGSTGHIIKVNKKED